MKDGILNINKPQNMTSHDVVAIARRALGIKKIGHTGTLDPMATGVLPICIGRATRIIEYLDMDIKAYRCKMILGMQTDTQDIWGEVLDTCPVNVTEDDVRRAFAAFDGVIDQKPPMYSALKVNGKKLYEYARAGQEVEVKSRKIFIKSLEIENIDLDSEEKTVTFVVECSKGTYIRTICQDAGTAMGCFGTLASLDRIQSGIFDLARTITIEELKTMPHEWLEERLYTADEPLHNFGKIVVPENVALKFITGWHIPMQLCEVQSEPRYAKEDFYLPLRDEFKRAYNIYGMLDGEETFLGVAFYDLKYKKLVADKVFYVR
ncbi:MAG: tRNA pseudouridine(55) synthase TruB [Firmicutes bacterium]|nr:tRNA pseudouridine(55) synthase TruB [Bacillota bacterium]